MNYLRIWVYRWIREFTTVDLRQAGQPSGRATLPAFVCPWLHCFNKAGKHILFLVTLFTSRKKVKLLTGLGRG